MIGGLVEFKVFFLVFYGFVVLVLVYFVYDDLLKVLIEFELEYFFEVCDWMLVYFDVMFCGLGVMGVFKGLELVFILVIYWKEVIVVVGIFFVYVFIVFLLKYKGELLVFFKFELDFVKLLENGVMIFKELYLLDVIDGLRCVVIIVVEKI